MKTPKSSKFEKKVWEIMDNHHCIVTEELGKRCVEAISNLVEEEVKRARVKELESFKIVWCKPEEFIFDPTPETFKRLWNTTIEDRISELEKGK